MYSEFPIHSTLVTLLTITLLIVIPLIGLNSSSACISYNLSNKTITVSCPSTTRLTDVEKALNNLGVLKKEPNKIWSLSSNLVVAKNASLLIDSSDTSWLKITSNGREGFGLKNYGKLEIDSVKITSWDSVTDTYASTSMDGKIPRAYIVSKSGATGKMNIFNSDIGYLGRDVTGEHGLDYYGGDGSRIQNNNIHHNWRGFYSAGVGHITFSRNVVHDNIQYGIDPHSGTHDMQITYNKAYNNNHGIICSVMCYNIHIENNEIYNNTRDGIFLDAGSHHSSIVNNTIYNEDKGIQLPSLSYSEVHGNKITNVTFGIIIYTQIGSVYDKDDRCGKNDCVSIKNTIHNNTIEASRIGVQLKDGASMNTFASNSIIGAEGEIGIMVDGSKTKGNIFKDNLISGVNTSIVLSKGNKDSKFINNNLNGADYPGTYTLTRKSTIKLEDTLFTNDLIRGADNTSNKVTISKSGIINVTDVATGNAKKHDTNEKAYSKILKSNGNIRINTISDSK